MDIGDIADQHAKRVALPGAIFLLGIAGTALYTTSPAATVIFVGVAAYGFFRLIAYIAFVFGTSTASVEETAGVRPVQILDEEDEDEEEAEPEVQPVQVESAQPAPRFYHLGTRQVQLPDSVKAQHLNLILAARAKGRLPDVTENKLNKIGVSRFALPPNARTAMEFLQGQGVLDKNGQWTDAGARCFPSPANGRAN